MNSILNAAAAAQRHLHDRLDRQPRQEDPAERAYWAAARASSVSGELCKLSGLIGAAIVAPLAFVYGGVFTPVGGAVAAAGVFSGSCVIAAVGSSATSNKRTAQLLALQTWERL